jgi:hypothetical protein
LFLEEGAMVRIDLVLAPIDGQVAKAKFDHCAHVDNLQNSIEDSDRVIESNDLGCVFLALSDNATSLPAVLVPMNAVPATHVRLDIECTGILAGLRPLST